MKYFCKACGKEMPVDMLGKEVLGMHKNAHANVQTERFVQRTKDALGRLEREINMRAVDCCIIIRKALEEYEGYKFPGFREEGETE